MLSTNKQRITFIVQDVHIRLATFELFCLLYRLYMLAERQCVQWMDYILTVCTMQE